MVVERCFGCDIFGGLCLSGGGGVEEGTGGC